MAKSSKYLKVFVICYLIFLYAPAFLLPIFSFNDSKVIAFPLTGFSTVWFEQLLHEDTLHAALRNSLIIAFSSTTLGTILGVLVARATSRYRFFGQKISVTFILVPLILPEIILGVCLLTVLIQLGLNLNLWTVVLGHTLIIMPFSTLIMVSAFNNLDITLEEASLDLGMNSFQTFRIIILPMVSPVIISSLLIGFVISLDEFIIAFFLTGVEPTLPVYIWAQFRFPAKLPSTMALGTILLLVSLILVSLFEYFRRRLQTYNYFNALELNQNDRWN